eukprot:CAMPEP_0114503692 /NCGR_PEP_ID=MMETSP0109-20121206/9790_1 /TAXON_ID=29199 /ORGANISM="Chlorarachnion reptans, Strain CCCM449" /LENGTH=401 /DNA_ID=CAMNT_0001681751 /DNA_START=191 /DNA_END=1396 /DNA_ORIENTATION=-
MARTTPRRSCLGVLPATVFTIATVLACLKHPTPARVLRTPRPAGRNLAARFSQFSGKFVEAVTGVAEGQKARFRLLNELKRQPSSQNGEVALQVQKELLARKSYPKINLEAPGVRVLNEEPPVYMVDNFLETSECDALIEAAESGELEQVKYSGAFVLLDHKRLWPIFPMIFLSAVPGSHALGSPPSIETFEKYLQVLGPNALLVGTMILLVPRIIETLTPILTKSSGAQFKGAKWVGIGALDESHPAKRAQESLLKRAEDLFYARRKQFERPTVTRYQKGQGQAVHSDAYPPAEPGKLQEYLAGGGQRLAQCLVYLNDVPSADGGSTKFFHPVLNGLEVQPKKGSALVFFPAFDDGTEDLRMMHSGETYVGEQSKWLAGTWLHQSDVPLTPHRAENQPGL